MNIAIFWRKYRNVEFQKKLTPDEVEDDSYEEALHHSKALEKSNYNTFLIEWKDNPIEVYRELIDKKFRLYLMHLVKTR